MAWRVSHVESFRQWEGDEEAELGDLLAKLQGDWPESEAMAAGTAFHSALETATEGEFAELHAMGHAFLLPAELELSLTPIRELRGTRHYVVDGQPIDITGQVDAMHGLRIEDHKTTGRFDPDRYLAGYQWRLYLDIFACQCFRWNVFEIAQLEPFVYEVRSQHTLEQFAYPGMHEDCQTLVERFARFVREHVAVAA